MIPLHASNLKVMSDIFSLFCFSSLKQSFFETGTNVSNFVSTALFVCEKFKFQHDAIKCLSMKQDIHITE